MTNNIVKKKNTIIFVICILLCLILLSVKSGFYKNVLFHEQKKITIGVFSDSYWEVQNGYSYKIINDAIKIFEEQNPNVEVEYVSGVLKADYSEWLAEQILMEKTPDVFFIKGEDFNNFAESGVLKELSSLINKDNSFNENAFYSAPFEYGKYDGKQYALPYECAPKLMFVNKTILDNEGIDMPNNDWTWEDFYKICLSVTKDTNLDGTIDQFGAVGYTWQEAAESNNVILFNDSGIECYFDSSELEEVITFIDKFEDITSMYNVTERDFDLGNVVFKPMLFSEFRAYKSYPLSVKKYSGFEWGCMPMPAGPQGSNISTLDTLLVGMSADTSNTKYAWDFIKILTYNADIQSEIFEYSEGVSVLKEVTKSDDTLYKIMNNSGINENMNLSILSDVVENAVVSPRFTGYQEANDKVGQAITEIINSNGNLRMEQIIWNREINKYLKQ